MLPPQGGPRIAPSGALRAGGGTIGPAAASASARAFPTANAAMNSRLKLLWIGIGKNDFLYQDNIRFRDWLRTQGVNFEWRETDGAHTWMEWRRYLTDFVPRLFR